MHAPATLDWQNLQDITEAVHDAALAVTQNPANCILASHALVHVLERLGYQHAYPLRVETAIHHATDRTFVGTLLGRDPWDRRPAEPNMWHGHLCVCVGADWLLDPTLDQANKPEWGAHQVGPLAIRLPSSFWLDPRGIVIPIGALNVRIIPYRRPQSGYAKAGLARPHHWRPIAEQVLAKIAGA